MEKKYLILLIFIIGLAIGIYGIVTMQLVLAGILLFLVVLSLMYLDFRSAPKKTGPFADGWSAVIAGAIVGGLFSMMHLDYLLWAVALAALFLIQQSLARIEQRLEILEKP